MSIPGHLNWITFVIMTSPINFIIASASAQVLSDPLESMGDETYTGGFGEFNWVDAASFGFTNHAGPQAFLSNYSGTPIPDIGMEKPLAAIIENGSYRVSFYYSRYSSINPVPFSAYDQLYIGSPDGTMLWDTVPTPVTEGEWIKWSGLFTPSPGDIGQPFRFGFSLTLQSATSLAIDGPLEIVHFGTTSIQESTSQAFSIQVICPPGADRVTLTASHPMESLLLFDAMGRLVHAPSHLHGNGWEIDASSLPAGCYSILSRSKTGGTAKGRFMLM